MRIMKKVSALILALCMVLTSFAIPAFAAGESIVGDASIYRAPVGTTQQIAYSVVDGSGAAVEGVVWSVSESAGVTIDENGVLSVEGSAAAGELTITATKDSTAIATKTVTILAKPEQYSDLFDRYYEDFEVYAEDATIAAAKGSPQRPSIKFSVPSGSLTIGKEANGNTYAKSTGLCYWGGKSGFAITRSWNAGNPPYMNGSNVETVEGRFMIESASATKQSMMWFESAGVRIGYLASSEAGKADIVYTDSNTFAATVNTNEWFDFRIEFDHTSVTYDVYLNDTPIITEQAILNDTYVGAADNSGGAFYIGASVDNLAMYNGSKKVADVETATISGDASIYRAPVGTTQQIAYSAVDDSNAAVSGVTWSVSDYAGVTIDENGILSVEGSAAAGELTITATKDSAAIATKTVTILAKPETYSDLFDRYYEDFEVYAEDTTIAMKGSPQRTSIKYSDPSGNGLLVGKENNGNTYAKATGLCYWGGAATLRIDQSWNSIKTYLTDSAVSTVEGRFMIESASATQQSLMWYENAGVRLGYMAAAETGKADVFSHGTKVATVNTNEWFDLRLELNHKAVTYNAYLNDGIIVDTRAMDNNLYVGAGDRGNGFYIGASVDNLAMYNGSKKVVPVEVEPVTISGDTNVYKAPVGTTQKLVYTADKALAEGAEWRLSGAPTGVTIDQNGAVKIPGSVAAGAFEVQVVQAGQVAGSKTVTILAKPETYSDLGDRYYEDFEIYENDAAIVMKGSPNRPSLKYDGASAAVGKEEDGNVYAKASLSDGLGWGSSKTTLKLLNSWNTGNVYMPDASAVVIEGRFKAETMTEGARWPMMWHSETGINISYELEEDAAYARLVYTDDSIAAGDDGNANSTIIAHVPVNTWFNLRVEMDYAKGTYSAFVGDACVIQNKAIRNTGARVSKNLVIAASVDDLAMYNGTKDATITGDAMSIIQNGSAVDNATRRFDFAEDGNFALQISKTMMNTSGEAKRIGLVVAVYNADKSLAHVSLNQKFILPGVMGSFMTEVEQSVTAGSYAKVFIWDMETLAPIE
ncbi:MAG: hypothetical protein IJB80_01310 [Clostridia bacterium]|nr:hypothetical protein [Clostridia bacterium]